MAPGEPGWDISSALCLVDSLPFTCGEYSSALLNPDKSEKFGRCDEAESCGVDTDKCRLLGRVFECSEYKNFSADKSCDTTCPNSNPNDAASTLCFNNTATETCEYWNFTDRVPGSPKMPKITGQFCTDSFCYISGHDTSCVMDFPGVSMNPG